MNFFLHQKLLVQTFLLLESNSECFQIVESRFVSGVGPLRLVARVIMRFKKKKKWSSFSYSEKDFLYVGEHGIVSARRSTFLAPDEHKLYDNLALSKRAQFYTAVYWFTNPQFHTL